VVLRANLPSYLKPIDLGLVEVDLGREGDCLIVSGQEFMSNRRSEVGSVKGIRVLSSRGNIHFLTLTAVHLDSTRPQLVIHSTRHHVLVVAKSTRTLSIRSLQEFAINNGETYN